MTSPAGSIGIGVSIDASDLTSEITAAVVSAMSDVLRTVRTGVGNLESVLGRIDTSGISQIAEAAQDASQAINRVDPSSLQQTASAAQEAARRLGQIDNTQLQRVATSAGEAQTAISRTTTETGQLGSSIQGLNIRPINNLSTAMHDVTQDAGRAADSVADVGDAADEAGKKGGGEGGLFKFDFKEMAAGAAGAAAAVLGIGTALETITEAIDRQGLGNKLAAQLDLSPEETAKAGKIAGDVYASNFGESFEQVNDAVGAVVSSLGNLTDDSPAAIQQLTEAALTLSDTFGVDVAESAQSVNNLIRNGLAKDGVEGFNLLQQAMSQVPVQMRDELLPILDEYSTNLDALGFTGPEAIGLIVAAAQGGAIAMDKAGDALKEFTLLSTDLENKDVQGVFADIGLSGREMADKIQAGGDVAQGAFQSIVDGLLKIPNKADQAAAAVTLFGTPLEDLDKTKIPSFLTGLQNADSALGDFSGATQRAGDHLADGFGPALEGIKRKIQQELIDGLNIAVNYINETAIPAVKDFAHTLSETDFVSSIKDAFSGGDNLFDGFIDSVKTGLTKLPGIVVDFIKEIPGKVEEFIRNIDWGNVGEALVNGIISFITSGGPLIVAAIAGLPLLIAGAVAVAIAAAGIGIVRALVDMFNENVLPWLAGLAEKVLDGIGDLAGAISGWFSDQWAAFTGTIGAVVDTTATFFSGLPGRIVGWIGDLGSALGGWFSQQWSNFTTGLGIIIDTASSFFSELPGKVFGWIGEIGASITTWFGGQWANFTSGLGAIVDTIAEPFNHIYDIITGVIDSVVGGAFETFKSAVSGVADFFGGIVDGIGSTWAKIKGFLAVPINFMINTVYNDGILKAWNTVSGLLGIAPASPLSGIPEAAIGGPIRGPGSGTSDDVLMWGSNGEHMLTAAEVARAGGHAAIYTIRDLIKRGIPFEWNNGQIINQLGRGNVDKYGSAVERQGLLNVDPAGLFDGLLTQGFKVPGFKTGGRIGKIDEMEPWMAQLANGHRAALMRNGHPYTWGFEDCSGYMSMIADAIINGGDGVRRWATAGFPGGQPFVPGLGQGFSVGVHDDPGGSGGGHTSGTLTGVGSYRTVNVESGGGTGGGPTYGGPAQGADSPYWDGKLPGRFHLDIGPNGFFQSAGPGSFGPSPDEQRGFIERKIADTFDLVLNPIKDGISSIIGDPPPEWRAVPGHFLDKGRDSTSKFLGDAVGNLGDALAGAWMKAKDVGSEVLSAVNPLNWFDSGGVAAGTGFMAKNVIEPERVLSPEQTRLFEALVAALTAISGSGGQAISSIVGTIGSSLSGVVGDVIKASISPAVGDGRDPNAIDSQFLEKQNQILDDQGRLISDTQGLAVRTQSSEDIAREAQATAMQAQLADIANRLTGGVLGPVMTEAVTQGLGVVTKALVATTDEVVDGTDRTTQAVKEQDSSSTSTTEKTPAPFGAPGSAFDAAAVISSAVVSVANTASSAVMAVAQDIAKAALAQTASKVTQSKGVLGKDVSGGFLTDLIVRLTGVEIQLRDLLTASAKDARDFRGDTFQGLDEAGSLISDTAGLIERSETSFATALSEQERINKALIKALLKYLMLSVVLPILTAVLGIMITVAVTAIGAAIGSLIPVIGTAIGAAIGAVVGFGLSTVAAAFIATAAIGAAAGIDSFDSGGVASGMGVLQKNTIAPERVLSPRQTQAFERMVDALDSGRGPNKSVYVGSQTFIGVDGPKKGGDDILSLLNS